MGTSWEESGDPSTSLSVCRLGVQYFEIGNIPSAFVRTVDRCCKSREAGWPIFLAPSTG